MPGRSVMDTQVRSRNQREEKLVEKIHQIMAIDGQAGLVAKVCMLTGLSEDEALYCYNQEICKNSGCYDSCHKLHVLNRGNGMTVILIDWAHNSGSRIYFAMMPTLLWERFRALTTLNEADVRVASGILKKVVKVDFSCLSKIFYAVMKTEMSASQIDALVGKASPCTAKCLLLDELDSLIDNYVRGWSKVGLVLPVL